MEAELTQFLIVCPLACLAGYIDAIAGGGGLITLPAYMLAGLPVHRAIATNKLSSSLGTAAATARYARNGYIPGKLAVYSVAGALAGSACGARLALEVGDGTFRLPMLAVLPVAAFYVLRKKDLDGGAPLEELPFRRTVCRCTAIALCTGAYDGFYGPGAGTFMLLLLTGAAGLDLKTAAGTTKIMNLSTNLAALGVYLCSGNVIGALGLTAGAFSIAGNLLGAASFSRRGSRLARPVILVVLAVFFVKLLQEFF